jgi:hypothetical protein
MQTEFEIDDLEIEVAPSGCGGNRVELAWLLIYLFL